MKITRRAISLATLLMVGMLASSLLSTGAFASVGICRSDPHIRLSDGTILMFSCEVAVSATSVKQVTYDLDIPTGTTVEHVNYTGGGVSEKVVVTSNTKPGTYSITVGANTPDSHARIEARARAVFTHSHKAPRRASAVGTVAHPPTLPITSR